MGEDQKPHKAGTWKPLLTQETSGKWLGWWQTGETTGTFFWRLVCASPSPHPSPRCSLAGLPCFLAGTS